MTKSYDVYDSEALKGTVASFDEAVAAMRDLGTPIVICTADGEELWHVYAEDGRWWQQYAAEDRKRNVTRQITTILQRLDGKKRWQG